METSRSALVVIVTGGASGIGEAAVLEFHRRGYTVVIADRDEEKGLRVAAKVVEGGGKALYARLDIADEQSCQDVVDATLAAFHKIDYGVNAAGIGGPALPAQEVPGEGFRQTMNIDLTGTFNFGKVLIRHWLAQEPRLVRHDEDLGLAPVLERGAIVNICSVNASVALHHMISLVAAKHGALGLTRSFAYENANKGIRVNAISPGCVFTPIMQAADFQFENVSGYVRQQAMKRFAHPEEIAPAIVFLCSDEASFITGTDMKIDAGWFAH